MKLQALQSFKKSVVCLFLYLVSVLFIAGGASAATATVNGITIDTQATAQAPWKAGEKVPFSDTYANLNWLGFYDVYRVFLGVTPQGYYVIQDFYADNNAKLSDPYVVRNESDVDENSYDSRDMTIEGPYIRWHANGQKYMEGQMVGGKEEGVWRTWYDNGQPRAVSPYISGKLSGWEEGWSESGTMTKRCHFKDNLLDGVCTIWHENGVKFEETTYSRGRSVGQENWWYDNGQLHMQGNRDTQGQLQGEWREWDHNGNLTLHIWYKDDQEVKREEHRAPAQQ